MKENKLILPNPDKTRAEHIAYAIKPYHEIVNNLKGQQIEKEYPRTLKTMIYQESIEAGMLYDATTAPKTLQYIFNYRDRHIPDDQLHVFYTARAVSEIVNGKTRPYDNDLLFRDKVQQGIRIIPHGKAYETQDINDYYGVDMEDTTVITRINVIRQMLAAKNGIVVPIVETRKHTYPFQSLSRHTYDTNLGVKYYEDYTMLPNGKNVVDIFIRKDTSL